MEWDRVGRWISIFAPRVLVSEECGRGGRTCIARRPQSGKLATKHDTLKRTKGAIKINFAEDDYEVKRKIIVHIVVATPARTSHHARQRPVAAGIQRRW